jgi:acyl-CoA thioester hydrolase
LGVLVREPADPEYVMRAQHVEYLAPARFDDQLEVYVRVRRIGNTSMDWRFEVFDVESGRKLVAADQTMVAVDLAKRRPVKIDDRYREAIAGFEQDLDA